MTAFGYTLMCEQSPPDQLLRDAQLAGGAAVWSDLVEHVEKIKPFVEAGFTEIALVQIGADHHQQFAAWAEQELLPALRSL